MDTNESPVMAVGEALAVLDWSQGRADPVKLAAARATFAAMAAEVEALRERVKLYGFMQNTGAADELRARAESAEARCEGLEAALMALCDVAELAEPESRYDLAVPIREARALLAATRATGGE